MRRWPLALCFALFAPGCADISDTDPADEVTASEITALRIEPADHVLELSGGQSARLDYHAIGTLADGSERDVTSLVAFQVSSVQVGIFHGSRFTSSSKRGGAVTVTASVDDGPTATTELKVRLARRFVVDGVVDGAVEAFASAEEELAASVELVYPASGVLVPPNLSAFEVQWMPAAGQKTYEVAFTNEGNDLRVYAPCVRVGEQGCALKVGSTLWQALVDAFSGDDPLVIFVRGLSADGTRYGVSNRRAMTIAAEGIEGGLYYWNARSGGIVRYDFGQPSAVASLFIGGSAAKNGGSSNGNGCVGCHALSAKGNRLAAVVTGDDSSALNVLDVASREPLATGDGTFVAFSPDGERLISADENHQMILNQATTLTSTGELSVLTGTMPDWSADGTTVAYVEPGQSKDPLGAMPFGVVNGSIRLLRANGDDQSWSVPRTLVPPADGQQNNFYPSVSADGEIVIFNRVGEGSSYDAATASLWAVRTDGNGEPVELTAANSGGVSARDLCNSWPKFTPYIRRHRGKKLLWFTFSSRRPRGLIAVKGKMALESRNVAQIWMAALVVDDGELGTTIESTPAFWLPFQDPSSGNHIAQWTAEVVRKACGIDGECPEGEACRDDGYCHTRSN